MNDTSPNTSRIAFVSALFGILALIVALWALSFGFFGALVIGLIVAAIVWAILWMGWKTPQGNATTAPVTQSSTTTTPAAPVATAPALVTPAAVVSAPVEETAAKPVAKKAVAKPVVAKAPSKSAAEKTAAKTAAAKVSADKAEDTPVKAKPAARPKKKPAVLAKAREGGPDDLKMIKGVGPVLEKALHEAGVFHFDQVGAWTNVDARWFDENVQGANGRVVRDEWIKQARILAKGGTTEFSNKVKKGGVY